MMENQLSKNIDNKVETGSYIALRANFFRVYQEVPSNYYWPLVSWE